MNKENQVDNNQPHVGDVSSRSSKLIAAQATVLQNVIVQTGLYVDLLATVSETGACNFSPAKRISVRGYKLMKVACRLVVDGGGHPQLGQADNIDYDVISNAFTSGGRRKYPITRGVGWYARRNEKVVETGSKRKRKRRAANGGVLR